MEKIVRDIASNQVGMVVLTILAVLFALFVIAFPIFLAAKILHKCHKLNYNPLNAYIVLATPAPLLALWGIGGMLTNAGNMRWLWIVCGLIGILMISAHVIMFWRASGSFWFAVGHFLMQATVGCLTLATLGLAFVAMMWGLKSMFDECDGDRL